MGTYERAYVSCQRVFLAFQGAQLVAFVTFHETRHEFTLDLIRTGQQAPDGTTHALIVAAIKSAKSAGCPRVSLASVAWSGSDAQRGVRLLRDKVLCATGHDGLKRFKSSFDPHWETLYAAAPSKIALLIAGLDIARRITAPTSASLAASTSGAAPSSATIKGSGRLRLLMKTPAPITGPATNS